MVTPAVLSVEKFSLSMPATSVSTAALSLGQDIDNCVPFMTFSADDDGNDSTNIDIVKNGGTNKFDLSASGGLGDREIEVTVVEFDPAEVTIQEVSFTLGSGLTANVTVSAIVEASTFPIIYGKIADTLHRYRSCMFQATFTSTTNLLLTKLNHTADITGHAYILEAKNGAWAIETGASIPTSYVSSDASKNTAITVTANRTALWSYYDTDESSDDARDVIWDGVITDASNLDLTRGNGQTPLSAGDIESFVVEFAADVAVVQQGEFNYVTATTKTAAITAPGTLANAMIVGTNVKGHSEASGAGFPSREGELARMSFNSATEVLGTRGATGTGNYRQNFQVIEWLIATAADDEPIIIMSGF